MHTTREFVILAASAGGATLILTVIFGFILLPILRHFKLGQPIRAEGPVWHKTKEGTPTMGGMCFILAFLLSVAGYAVYRALRDEGRELVPLALAVLYALGNAAIGFIDDYCKLIRKQNEGLSESQKLLLQLVLAAAFLAMLRATGHLETSLRIPFTDYRLELSWFSYPVYLLVMLGVVNATNLTDGLDGLASSVCATVAAFMLLLAVSRLDADSTVLSVALLAGVLGFLVFNHNPAQMFMGDTGSLFLGGVIIGVAMMMGELLLFVLAAFVFVMDMLTSFLQRAYFKLTHGKRLFPIAPIHHSFEKWGWSEYGIMALFSGVSVLFCVLAWLGR